ncbi:histidine-containing phosphotransfer protein 6 [Quercus suber]|uniref:Histidine-containing phosphotransfer protein n=1 Tax=Quercus suber TaxID=58331 RepID=A0AAW0K079_QUESU
MLGLGVDRLRADMNRLLALLFHQVIMLINLCRTCCFHNELLVLEYWMSNSCSFSSFKMRAPQTLSLRLLISISTSPKALEEPQRTVVSSVSLTHIHMHCISNFVLTCFAGLLDGMDKEFSDYKKIGIHLNQFMGSSSSIGAKRVRNVCVAFRAASEQNNRAGCLRALELLEHEYCYLKNKLHELFHIEQQRVLAAGVRYPMQH